jgi:hypothetical protein
MTAERVNLLIPAGLVGRLDIPPRSLTTGGTDPVWLDAPANPNRLRRKPTIRLPYDVSTATALRRGRLYRLPMTGLVGAIIALSVAELVSDYTMPKGMHLLSSAGLATATFAHVRWLNPTLPTALPGGDLYLREVPADVAAEWLSRNPGIRIVDRRPAMRRFRPLVYSIGAAAALVAATQIVILLANDGVDDPLGAWLTAPALTATAAALAYKSLRRPHVTFPL